MTKEKMVEELTINSIEAMFSIRCNNCKKQEDDEFSMDAEEAADNFYDGGWRIINDETLCIVCAKKERKKIGESKNIKSLQ